MIDIKTFVFCVFFCLIFTNGIIVIWNKYKLTEKLQIYSMKIGSKFLYKLSCCEFCVEHHLAILPTLILFLMGFKDCINIFIPFLTSSLLQMIKSYYNEKNKSR